MKADFAGVPAAPTTDGLETTFGAGSVKSVRPEGFDRRTSESLDSRAPDRSPVGPTRSPVRSTTGAMTLDAPLKIGWTLVYDECRAPGGTSSAGQAA